MSLEKFLQENTEAARELAREMKQLREAMESGKMSAAAAGTAAHEAIEKATEEAVPDSQNEVEQEGSPDDAAERKAVYKSINKKINAAFEAQADRKEVIARLQKGQNVKSLDGLGVDTVKKLAAIPLDKIIKEYKAELEAVAEETGDEDLLGGDEATDTPNFEEMDLAEFRVPFAEIQKHPKLGKEVLRNIAEEFKVKQVTKVPREKWPQAWAMAQEILGGVK